MERSGGSTELPFKETNDIRLHAKSLTELDSDDLTAEQAAWKLLYDSLTEELVFQFGNPHVEAFSGTL